MDRNSDGYSQPCWYPANRWSHLGTQLSIVQTLCLAGRFDVAVDVHSARLLTVLTDSQCSETNSADDLRLGGIGMLHDGEPDLQRLVGRNGPIYFSRRYAILTAVGASVAIVGAFVLDQIRSKGNPDMAFSVIYASGIFFATLSFFFFNKMQDIPRVNPVKQSLREGIQAIGAPFGDKRFRGVLLFLGMATVGQTFAGNFYFAYGRETLSLSFVVLVGASTVQAIGQVISAKFWGFLSDKYGNKPALILAGLGLALCPIPWVLCMPGRTTFNESLLLTTHFFMGIVWSGINI